MINNVEAGGQVIDSQQVLVCGSVGSRLGTTRDRGQQFACVCISGIIEERMYRSLLDHASVFHDQNLISNACDHAKIVADEYHSQIALATQLIDQLKYLALNSDIQCSGGFIGDQ